MKLGNFSLSIAVKDIAASRQFCEKPGFSKFGGDQAQGITPEFEVDESGNGPGSFVIRDPDGNVIIFDQHV